MILRGFGIRRTGILIDLSRWLSFCRGVEIVVVDDSKRADDFCAGLMVMGSLWGALARSCDLRFACMSWRE